MIRTVVGMPKVLEEAHRGGGGPPWWGRSTVVENAHYDGGRPPWLTEARLGGGSTPLWEDARTPTVAGGVPLCLGGPV